MRIFHHNKTGSSSRALRFREKLLFPFTSRLFQGYKTELALFAAFLYSAVFLPKPPNSGQQQRQPGQEQSEILNILCCWACFATSEVPKSFRNCRQMRLHCLAFISPLLGWYLEAVSKQTAASQNTVLIKRSVVMQGCTCERALRSDC